MKRILLIIFLIPLLLQSQWITNSGSNKFDGNYKSAMVIGKGGEWPYTKPQLVINRFEENEPNIYLTNIGYTGCSNNKLRIAFNDDDNILICDYPETNSGDDAIFIDDFRDTSIHEFINALKSKNKIYIRFSNSCGKEDYVFSLHGSSRAIDFVVGDYYKDSIDVEVEEEEENFTDQYVNFIKGFKCGDILNPKLNAFVLYVTKPETTLSFNNGEFVITDKDKLQFFNLYDDKRVYTKVFGETGFRKEILLSKEDCLLITDDPRITKMFDYLEKIDKLQSACQKP